MSINREEVYTASEVASFLKVTPTYINKLCKSWKLKATKLNPESSKRITWRVLGKNLLEYINEG